MLRQENMVCNNKSGRFLICRMEQEQSFWALNVAARSNTPDHKTAERLAERFASMGVNVIRLHAADAPMGKNREAGQAVRKHLT